MATLYLANTTPQNQRIYYRLDFDKEGGFIPLQRPGQKPGQARMVQVPSGRQVPLTSLSREQIKDIIDQLLKYGLRAHDYKPGRGEGIIPYLYREDAPVPEGAFLRIKSHNKGIRTIDGQRRRQAAAIAAHQAILNVTEAEPEETVVEIEQLREEGDDPKEVVAEGFQVGAQMSDRPPPVAGAPRRRRAA